MNYYELLSVDNKATVHEIKKAYRDLIKQYHSDIVADDTYHYKLNEAANVLLDPKKRKNYDLLLRSSKTKVPHKNTHKLYDIVNEYDIWQFKGMVFLDTIVDVDFVFRQNNYCEIKYACENKKIADELFDLFINTFKATNVTTQRLYFRWKVPPLYVYNLIKFLGIDV